jgi:hypothetical protein
LVGNLGLSYVILRPTATKQTAFFGGQAAREGGGSEGQMKKSCPLLWFGLNITRIFWTPADVRGQSQEIIVDSGDSCDPGSLNCIEIITARLSRPVRF